MTQEISDYLLIRYAFLEFDSNTIIDSIQSKETYEKMIDTIANIIQEENYFLIDDEMPKKISNVIKEYRFVYKEKKIIEKTNYIIEKLNDYKSMTLNRKNNLIKRWIKEETTNRRLPILYSNIETLKDLIIFDAECTLKIRNNENIELKGDDVIKYISFFNIVKTKSNNNLEEKFNSSNIYLLNEITKLKKYPLLIKSIAKKSLKSYEKEKRLVKELKN